MTITDLLLTEKYMGNQSKLAVDLKVNRTTVRLYMTDKEGDHHFVCVANNELYGNLSNKISNKV